MSLIFSTVTSLRSRFKTAQDLVLSALLLGSIVTLLIVPGEYLDLPVYMSAFIGDAQIGRTKNSVATLVSGLVARELYEQTRFKMTVEKTLWPDAEVIGHTSRSHVDASIDLTFTNAHFRAQRNEEGQLHGEVDKSEFDWSVEEAAPGVYYIGRLGPKFDATLKLSVKDELILGEYIRPGPDFNWDIRGVYTLDGQVKIMIDAPLTLGITLRGKVTPQLVRSNEPSNDQ